MIVIWRIKSDVTMCGVRGLRERRTPSTTTYQPKRDIKKENNGMLKAVIFARVASHVQKSAAALTTQLDALREYAASKGISIVREFTYYATSARPALFDPMVPYLREHSDVRIILVERTDRLCRTLKDYVHLECLVEKLGITIHLVKENRILGRDCVSQGRLVEGMFALLARNYTENMRKEIRKGQLRKAESGQYPGRTPYGYVLDRKARTLVEHPVQSDIVRLIFQLYSSGQYTLTNLSRTLEMKKGERLMTSTLRRILESDVYSGTFTWQGRRCVGTYPKLVDSETFNEARRVKSLRSERTVNGKESTGEKKSKR
jgi:site-specific DNA recombinase